MSLWDVTILVAVAAQEPVAVTVEEVAMALVKVVVEDAKGPALVLVLVVLEVAKATINQK